MRRVPAFLLCMLATVVGVTPSAATECPQAVLFQPTLGASSADTGFTGQAHDKPILGNTLPLGVSCAATAPPCGTCTITGALPAAGGNYQRCANDTSIACTVATEVADCGAPARCKLYSSGPQAVMAAGVPSCLVNAITGPIGGTVEPDTGAIAATFPFAGDVFVVVCPACVGDPTANDGVRGGTCDTGPNAGQACDAHGISRAPWDELPITSLDCPPNPGSLAATLSPGAVTFSTATQSRTVSAATPLCRETGFAGLRCLCDTCNSAAAEPCSTDADCPLSGGNPGVCGGRRCIGGPNHGAPCALHSECPTGVCNRLGEATRPNSCYADPETAAFEQCVDTPPLDGHGECPIGPVSQFCSNHPNRSCVTDHDCDDVPNTCTFASLPCFVGGTLGATVSASGAAVPPAVNVSNPTELGMLGCVSPAPYSAINAAVGLPGLTRNHQVGRLTYGEELVSMMVPPGGTVSTVGAGPTSDVEATVTSPPGGTITILTTFATATPPADTELTSRVVQVTAPAAMAASPLVVTLALTPAVIPPGQTEISLETYLNGVGPIPNCIGATTAVPSDPCVSARTAVGGAEITVLSTVGGTFALAYEPGLALCPPTPDLCRSAPVRQSQLRLNDRDNDKADQLSWKWTHGAATTIADFGDPLATDDYALCLYDAAGRRARYRIPFGGSCAGKPCWQSTSKGFLYKNRDATPSGITQVKLTRGDAGKAQLQVVGKGALLPTPLLLSLAPPLQVQLRNVTTNRCWGATYGPLDRQSALQIKDKSD